MFRYMVPRRSVKFAPFIAGVALLALTTGCGTIPSTSVEVAAGVTTASSPTPDLPIDDTVVQEAEPDVAEEPAAEEPSLTELKLGAGITVTSTDEDDPSEMAVTVISKKSSTRALSEYGDRPKGAFVGFLVKYECTLGSCDYNPYDFTLRNEAGEEFDKSYENFDPDLNSGKLRKGRNALGYVTYEIKPGKYYLEYSSSLLTENSASWNVTIK
jgi:hypothetical protein